MNKHPSHENELKKLNRIVGQVEGISRMIGEGRYCPDIIAQLRAARAALRSVEASVLETHLQHCVTDAMMAGNRKKASEKIMELGDLLKRFDQ
jgi:DNA-binding FrmR family transcriptional regulator